MCREVTCVRGLSKHPSSFHRDVAFTTGADLAEFDCGEASELRERRALSPSLGVTLQDLGPLGLYLSPRLGRGHRRLPSWHPGCSSTRPEWCSGPGGGSRAAGLCVRSSIPCGRGLRGGPLAGPRGCSDLCVIEAPCYYLFMALWDALALQI